MNEVEKIEPSTSDPSGAKEPTVLEMLRRIQSGQLSPRNISTEARRAVVEHLSAEGYSGPEVAEILQVNERTIRRDRAKVREENALDVDPGLVREMAGSLVQEAETAIAHMRKAARSREAGVGDKIEAEATCWRIRRELVEKLQSLGYLPQAPLELRGQIASLIGLAAPGQEALLADISELMAVAPPDGDAYKKLALLKGTGETLRLGEQVAEVEATGEGSQ